jgi:hypothetical protein
MGFRPQKSMVVGKTKPTWDKSVDKLCAFGVQHCTSVKTAIQKKKAAGR